jgi:hypothetical protein
LLGASLLRLAGVKAEARKTPTANGSFKPTTHVTIRAKRLGPSVSLVYI